jgi:hypothetical protein
MMNQLPGAKKNSSEWPKKQFYKSNDTSDRNYRENGEENVSAA